MPAQRINPAQGIAITVLVVGCFIPLLSNIALGQGTTTDSYVEEKDESKPGLFDQIFKKIGDSVSKKRQQNFNGQNDDEDTSEADQAENPPEPNSKVNVEESTSGEQLGTQNSNPGETSSFPATTTLGSKEAVSDTSNTSLGKMVADPLQNVTTPESVDGISRTSVKKAVAANSTAGLRSFAQACEEVKNWLIGQSTSSSTVEPVRRAIARVLNRNAWKEFAMKWREKEMIKQLVDDVGKPAVLQQRKMKYGVEVLIPKMMKHFECVENQTNDEWTEKYIEFVDSLNRKQIESRDYHDLVLSINSSIEKLISLTVRVRTIKDVFKQNLEGVPSGVLVLGKMEIDPDDLDQRPVDSFQSIERNAKVFLRNSSIKNFIMKDISIAGNRFTNAITRYSSAKIEPSGSDPVYHTFQDEYFVVQRYRIFPVFERLGSIGTTRNKTSPVLNKVDDGISYWTVETNQHPELPESINIRARVAEMLNQIENEESTSSDRILGFEGKYASNLKEIRGKIAEESNRLRGDVSKAQAKILGLDPTYTNSSVATDLEALLSAGDNAIENMRAEWGPGLTKELENKEELFKNNKDQALEVFENHISARTMTIFTKEDELQSTSDTLRELRQKLIERAYRDLDGRKSSLVSYRVSVIRDGKLESEDADQYYDRGRVTRSILMAPVLRDIGDRSQGTKQKLEILLLQEIRFNRRSSGSITSGNTSEGPAEGGNRPDPVDQEIVADVPRGLEWYLPLKNECWARLEGANKVPSNYEIPTENELETLSDFLKKKDNADLVSLFPYLRDQENYVWAKRARSGLEDEFRTFNLLTRQKEFEPEDSCNYIVGVRRFG
jgi:hypothetical protein